MYVKKRLSLAQISKLTFSSKSTVLKALRKFGIELREAHFRHDRIISKVLHLGLDEQTLINMAMRMREESLSLRAISRVLDQLKIQNENGLIRWHPQMIKRLLSISESPSLR